MKYEEGLVSVVMPTYKRAEKLPRAIESVLSQTYKKIELFVVNDNDPDDEYTSYVKKITKRYANDQRFNLVIQDKHVNGAVARNIGILKSKGEYIAFLDDDDWWETNKIEEQIKELEVLDSTWGGVSCKFRQFDQFGHVIGKTHKYSDGKIYKDIINMYTEVATGTILLRRVALDDTGYFDTSLLRSQDIQLLSCFTFKYKLKEVDQYLHCADVSDAQNRLVDEKKFLQLTNDFFKSINHIVKSMTKSEIRCAYNMRFFTLGYILIREHKYGRGIKYLLKTFSNIQSSIIAIKLIYRRLKEKKL